MEIGAVVRPLRIDLPGGWYHLTSRGNERGRIDRNDSARACGERSRMSEGLRVGAESVNADRAMRLNIRKNRSDSSDFFSTLCEVPTSAEREEELSRRRGGLSGKS